MRSHLSLHRSCVLNLIREGRCALVTSFRSRRRRFRPRISLMDDSCFKYMAMYSFTEFTTILILYWLTSNYGDLQYLYIDLLTITTLALCMGRFDVSQTRSSPHPGSTGPYQYIVKERPPGRFDALNRSSCHHIPQPALARGSGWSGGTVHYPGFVPSDCADHGHQGRLGVPAACQGHDPYFWRQECCMAVFIVWNIPHFCRFCSCSASSSTSHFRWPTASASRIALLPSQTTTLLSTSSSSLHLASTSTSSLRSS